MRLPRRLVAALAALALLASACTQAVDGTPEASSGTATTPAPLTPTISFRDCTSALIAAGLPIPAALKGRLQIGCAPLSVPLDYAHPDGAQITLYIVRIHDTDDAHPIGSLLMNPGGPGVSGLNFALDVLSELPATIVQHFDLIGFDPRGVGLSSPIRCLSNQQKDTLLAESPDITTAAGFAEADREAKQFSHACESKYGSALQYYNTVDTARDMDRIRRAVGDSRMNYLGFSYGTELGWTYVHLFPKTTRAIVLDGAVDPDTSEISQSANQIGGFEKAFDQFAANCRTVAPCDQLGDPRAAVQRIASAAQRTPLSTSSGRKLTYALALTGVLQALYSKKLWPQLATALISAGKGDGSGLLKLADDYNERSADGSYTNVEDANLTISCNDSKGEPSDATIRSTARSWVVKYPMFGRWDSSGLLGCAGWTEPRTPVPDPKAATATKVLVLGNLNDPATPYRGAQDLTRDLGNAELLTWNGAGHTSYLQGSTCIDDYVNTYLLTLKLPPRNTTCQK